MQGENTDRLAFTERDLLDFLELLINRSLGGEVTADAAIDRTHRVDIILRNTNDHSIKLVEVKRTVPQTIERLKDVIGQLLDYAAAYTAKSGMLPSLVLAIPGTLGTTYSEQLSSYGIEVWDADWITQRATETGLRDEADFFTGRNPQAPKPAIGSARLRIDRELASRLTAIECGKGNWYEYQRLCGEILEFLLCPPLNSPISERSNKTRTNRRDLIFPNYATDGFFGFIYTRYNAEHVVVDAKNYCEPTGKNEVITLANYLVKHGPGLFGIIVTRVGEDRGAYEVRREQWMHNQKMICVITDDDLRQMIATKAGGGDPALLIRQKIEDFRLAV